MPHSSFRNIHTVVVSVSVKLSVMVESDIYVVGTYAEEISEGKTEERRGRKENADRSWWCYLLRLSRLDSLY